MKTGTYTVYEIEKDGLPTGKDKVGRVAFIFDGCIVSGFPLQGIENQDGGVYEADEWEANGDVGRNGVFKVSHYVIFDHPLHSFAFSAE